ncbi:MAG: hypothetical protein M3Y87_00550 [Myxococcota bacterium]|nr:hypothetical protein [Myxococcota bacterium]
MQRIVGFAWLGMIVALGGCLGVETYRERMPAPTLAIRLVAIDPQDAEVLPRLSGDTSELLAIERAEVVGSENIRRVRLLDAAQGVRVLVLEVDEIGRARLEEASRAHIGGRMAVVVDGRVVAAPTILNPLTEREVYVSVAEPDVERAFGAISASE